MALKRLCGLWKKQGRDGRIFLTGEIDGKRLLIFANDRKDNDKQPDYAVFEAIDDDDQPDGQPQQPARQPTRRGVSDEKYQQRKAATRAFTPPADDLDDSIPF